LVSFLVKDRSQLLRNEGIDFTVNGMFSSLLLTFLDNLLDANHSTFNKDNIVNFSDSGELSGGGFFVLKEVFW